MFELLPLIAVFLTPLWGYLLWRRMKRVQQLGNETAKAPERLNILPVEDNVRSEGGLNFSRPLSFDDNLATAEKSANAETVQKNLEGRKH